MAKKYDTRRDRAYKIPRLAYIKKKDRIRMEIREDKKALETEDSRTQLTTRLLTEHATKVMDAVAKGELISHRSYAKQILAELDKHDNS